MRVESAFTSLPAVQAVYLGRDWVMYAGAPGDDEMSEMGAPAIVMSFSGPT
jgi:hypothetical protein